MNLIACITCYDGDVDLLQRSLSYLDNQEEKPDCIVCCVSGSEEAHAKCINELEKHSYDNFDAVFYSPERKKPGGARNMLIDNVSDYHIDDVVVFCDVDDLIHPAKFKVVRQIFSECSYVDACIHDYQSVPRNVVPSEVVWDKVEHGSQYSVGLVTEHEEGSFSNVKSPLNKPIAHGHMSCKLSVLEIHRYDETMSLGEDGMFCRSIVDDPRFNLYHLDLELIAYLS